ncbi:MAG TPA: ATP-binding cassette domain-containing protein [Candidatus Acidoferrales bacterium]|nr:ATP-binding cassette domain-containing protein [Candidatus Acidoferrales bacterium]
MATPLTIEPVPAEPLIWFEDVRIGFDEGEVLRGISFAVQPRETKVIIGESGSGKTVLLKLAAGLLRPDSGRVVVMGHDLTEMREVDLLDFRRSIGFVFQEGALFDSISVSENVAFRLSQEGISPEESEARVREVLRFVELEEAYEKSPPELSGGMRRRVSIARAIISRPPIVYYDSPTGGLDPVTSQTIITLILRLRDYVGATSLLATHRLQDAFGLANFEFDFTSDRVIPIWEDPARAQHSATTFLVLRDGKIYFEGEPTELLKSEDSYLRQFLF